MVEIKMIYLDHFNCSLVQTGKKGGGVFLDQPTEHLARKSWSKETTSRMVVFFEKPLKRWGVSFLLLKINKRQELKVAEAIHVK